MDVSPAAALSLRDLCGPSAVYVTGEEQLRVTAYNAAAGVTLGIRGRFLDLSGHIEPFASALTPATDRTASTKTIPLAEGWLQNLEVFATAGTPIIGQTFVVVELVRGDGAAALSLATLAAGYVTAVQRLAYPGSKVQGSLDGAGALRTISGTTPAAGVELAETVPTGACWELLAFRMSLVTDNTVANRFSALMLSSPTSIVVLSPMTPVTPASTTNLINCWQGAPQEPTIIDQQMTGPLPFGIRLPAGYKILSSSVNLAAGDQYGSIVYLVREWIEGA